MDGKGQAFGQFGKRNHGGHPAKAAGKLAKVNVTCDKAFTGLDGNLARDADGVQRCDRVMNGACQIFRVLRGTFIGAAIDGPEPGPTGFALDNIAIAFVSPARHDLKPVKPFQRVAFAEAVEPLMRRDFGDCMCHCASPSLSGEMSGAAQPGAALQLKLPSARPCVP